jgi:hypothetical protein
MSGGAKADSSSDAPIGATAPATPPVPAATPAPRPPGTGPVPPPMQTFTKSRFDNADEGSPSPTPP